MSTGTSSDSRDLAMTPIANGSGDSGDLGCDALVFFGASGDLAYKQIFPALAALVERGVLGVPIIGVARAGWTVEEFVERARRSLEDHRMLDESSFGRFASLLRFVDGDYGDPETSTRTRASTHGRRSRGARNRAGPSAMTDWHHNHQGIPR